MPPAAVVKFGSTSTTLLIAERLSRPTLRQQQLVDLFSPQGPARIVEVARTLSAACHEHRSVPLAAGGEALRLNPELERELRSLFPHWWHLSSDEEGRLAWMAVKADSPSCDLVIDMGGGSTEFISQRDVQSVAVGAARGSEGKPGWPDLRGFHRPVFIGGTAVTLARWMNSWTIGAHDLQAVQQTLEEHPKSLDHLDVVRRRILPRGLALMTDIMDAADVSEFRVSERGLTEGLWLACSLGRGARV